MTLHMQQHDENKIELQKTVRELEERLHRVEKELFKIDDGSGTGRYPDNWTQTSDGNDYPGSYGVGPSTAQKTFVPFDDPIKSGDQVRVIGSNGVVDSVIHVVVGAGADTLAVDDGNSYPRDKVVRVVQPTKQVSETQVG
jgi:uncharacterized protein with von Willebrand factor type A (vWA) domain